ncbi:MAG: TetR/AcrR family transcriptional regulator [Microbacterium sp.]|uniref:TetR/AcrR family transcriptional regulator n=1 Tax=Microbacterium sp. TaxID=51671 RepID=UPI003A85F11C
MPKISDARREQRRAQIIDAALSCFTRTSYQRTTMADIIAESGLSAGAIYGYYASKQELLLAVAETILGERRAELVAATGEGDLSPAGIVATIARGVRVTAPFQVLIQVWGEATVDPSLRELVHTVLGHLRSTIGAALENWATRHPEAVALPPQDWARRATPVVMALLPGFIVQSALVDDFNAEAFLTDIGLVLP